MKVEAKQEVCEAQCCEVTWELPAITIRSE